MTESRTASASRGAERLARFLQSETRRPLPHTYLTPDCVRSYYEGMKPTTYTVHGVLAGAYRGRLCRARALLLHASVDGAESSLCKRTRNLCDAEESGEVDCPECLARIARRGLTRT